MLNRKRQKNKNINLKKSKHNNLLIQCKKPFTNIRGQIH